MNAMKATALAEADRHEGLTSVRTGTAWPNALKPGVQRAPGTAPINVFSEPALLRHAERLITAWGLKA